MEAHNPQHYQSLSHALRLPPSDGTIPPAYTYLQQKPAARHEEEEDDDGEEEVVERQLNRDHESTTSPSSSKHSQPDPQQQGPIIHQYEPEAKRRPGRPKGSKNRKRESQPPSASISVTPATTIVGPSSTSSTAPQNSEVTPQNQAYYEFQWRVLQLCGEFYSAAEELVKAANPLVIAQCYHAGPENKVDPIVMLTEAKRTCDDLIKNPSRLITAPPPPPMYPTIPTFYHPAPAPPTASVSAPPAPPSQPPTFVAPMPPPPHFQPYAPPPGYQYPYPSYPAYAPAPAGFYPPPQPAQAHPPPAPAVAPVPAAPASAPAAPSATPAPTPAPAPVPVPSTSAPTISVMAAQHVAPSTSGSNQGAWSDVEIDRLRNLAQESKAAHSGGDPDWDWVISRFGNERSRHQILLKATALGLKESSTRPTQIRGTKRRREEEASPPPRPTPSPPSITHTNSTPTESQGPTTPASSPTLQKPSQPPAQRPPSSKAGLPWPMPTVAAPVTIQDKSIFYRPSSSASRTHEASKPISGPAHATHPYMYNPHK